MLCASGCATATNSRRSPTTSTPNGTPNISCADRRSVSLRLTSKGKKALASDPFEVLVRAVDSLDAKERTEMHHTLHKVLTTVAASGAHRCFGVCQDCTYLGGETCSSSTSANASGLECLLFGVPIEP